MNKPEDMFDIVREKRLMHIHTGGTFEIWSYYLIYKHTGEKHFSKVRKYGYSELIDAKRARTRLFNNYIKSLEEALLG